MKKTIKTIWNVVGTILVLPDLLFGEDEGKKKAKAEVPVEELPAEPDESVNLSGEEPEKNGGTV